MIKILDAFSLTLGKDIHSSYINYTSITLNLKHCIGALKPARVWPLIKFIFGRTLRWPGNRDLHRQAPKSKVPESESILLPPSMQQFWVQSQVSGSVIIEDFLEMQIFRFDSNLLNYKLPGWGLAVTFLKPSHDSETQEGLRTNALHYTKDSWHLGLVWACVDSNFANY